ncbi:MAG: hypothetical protein IT380_16730 [Myxococcales bacterium]|nr:hypothetical protein [Myxococcales bacterium]
MRISSAAVLLPVSNWPLVLPWYRDVLGCRVVNVDESLGQVVHLQFGRQRFGLHLDWGSPRAPRVDPTQVRAPTLALFFRSLAEARRSLKTRGLAPSRTPTGLLVLRDPEGNELLLLQEARRRDARRARRRAAELAEGSA